MDFPPVLVPYAERILKTARGVNYIDLTECEQDLPPWESKVGGMPYLPAGSTWPKSIDGAPLVFLAQINFAQMPALPSFPSTGMVQFFIGDNDQYGAQFDNEGDEGAASEQRNFAVRYHEQVVTDSSLLHIPEAVVLGEYTPHDADQCLKMTFENEIDYVSATDRGIDNILDDDIFQVIDDYAAAHGVESDDVAGAIFDTLHGTGHKVGGYPAFTQQDPRAEDSDLILLFQLDSEDGISWGDMGIGHFFIRPDDLLRKDFSRVMYSWDCC